LHKQSKTATTNDGKTVILNDDKTWEYIDSENAQAYDNSCNLGEDYK